MRFIGTILKQCASSHATEIRGNARLPIISGLNGYLKDGKTMPESSRKIGTAVATKIKSLSRRELQGLGALRADKKVLAKKPTKLNYMIILIISGAQRGFEYSNKQSKPLFR